MELLLSAVSSTPAREGQQGHISLNVNAQDIYQNTPLHCAAGEEQEEGIVFLARRARAKLNLPNANGQTPLHVAALKGNLKLVRKILAAGSIDNQVDTSVRDAEGQTAWEILRQFGIPVQEF